MRHFGLILIMLSVIFHAKAIDIPQGTFFFDNSKTQFSQVKFVYGSDNRKETYVVSMTAGQEARWSVTMQNAVSDMYRYTFADTSLPDGKISDYFSNVKNNISNTRNEKRTATTDKPIIVNATYVPASGDNWASGAWQLPQNTFSGTLPVMFITTEGNSPIVSKEDYLNATYYVDALGLDGYESIGSADAPLPLQIRGRGNYTWIGFDKKPYRLKLASKAALLGMKKSRHFALLAHADDDCAFLRNTVGFELSRRLGLKFTPAQEPVEVVLNGEYIGLYMLTETIRIDEDRVNIVEQPDNETDEYNVTGGWLVEIDNYDEADQVRITEGNGEIIRFTYKSPEILSDVQKSYLTQQVTAMDNGIYASDKSRMGWADLIDVDSLVRFYIVQEILDNAESFHGSCYLHKDRGMDTKWIFGPVWDFGNSFRRSGHRFIYDGSPYGQTWIGEMAKFPSFQEKLIACWKNFHGGARADLGAFIDGFIARITTAAGYNAARWPDYGNPDVRACQARFESMMNDKIDWLVQQWGEGTGVDKNVLDVPLKVVSLGGGVVSVSSSTAIASVALYDMAGRICFQDKTDGSMVRFVVPTGAYVLQVVSAQGAVRHAKVLVR